MLDFQYIKTISYQEKASFNQQFRTALQTTKVVHLKNIPEDGDLMEIYTQITQNVGELIRRGEDFDKKEFTKDQWLDVRYNPNLADVYRHSNTAQPLHTDGAYIVNFDYELVFLFCTEQADYGGATIFIDGDLLYELLQKYEPRLLSLLESEVVFFSKGTFGAKKAKIIDRDEKSLLLNWNFYRIAENNSDLVKKMTNDFQNFLQNNIVAGGLTTNITLQKGEAVFFHDRRVLHGRNAFLGNRCLIKGALNL